MGREKLTHHIFQERLQSINKNIILLEKYTDMKTKILCKCKIDNNEWSALPQNLLKGKGCPVCGTRSRTNKRKANSEDVINRIVTLNSNLLVKSEYVNMNTKLLVECKKCGHQFQIPPRVKNIMCPECSKRDRHSDFVSKMDIINPDIEILSIFESMRKNVKCKCRLCGHIWETQPKHLIYDATGCPQCANLNHRLSHEEFVDKLHKVNPSIIVLGEYITSTTPILVKCRNDGHEWLSTPNTLLNGTGCIICFWNSMKLTTEDFKKKLHEVNPTIEILGEYVNTNTHIEYRCLNCNNIHTATPSNLLRGYGCPYCNMSKGERKCIEYFNKNNIFYVTQFSFDNLIGIGGNSLRFDFAVFINNDYFLLEFDGIFHYQKVYDTDGYDIIKEHDSRKNTYCLQNNIKLLRIPYWEFDNIDEIISDYINKFFKKEYLNE